MTRATRLTSDDLYLYNEGTHYKLYDKLGAHRCEVGGKVGTYFAVWAPNAAEVSVKGDWNGWQANSNRLSARENSGIWEGFFPDVGQGQRYKYHIRSHQRGYTVDKADPYGFMHETPPHTASVIWSLDYEWNDGDWMRQRAKKNALDAPISIYEMHLGSFMRVPEENRRSLTYRELAPKLADYMLGLGFTHVEFMPVMEHPFAGSWGYQVTGYFAPTSRFGTPQDFMYLVEYLHQRGIGVILDWVPAHFPSDEHGLGFFDGTHLYEHADPRLGFHPDWKSCIFNYARNEVHAFLISSALFWLDAYHIDGLRVDGVASMLYRDYSRKAGEWIPNEYGGRENLEAVKLLRDLNSAVYADFPDVQTIAEESTAWPQVSRPTYLGGLGFGLKWDMGFMHDTLAYFEHEPVHRKFHHNLLTFRSIYAFHENFVLPLSHDEVVHGKGSLLAKMPGDEWQRFANLRLLYAYMFAQPGKKLLFMGGEFGQGEEWDHDSSLNWAVAGQGLHAGVQRLMTDLNRIYRTEPALHERDVDVRGFEWIAGNDSEQSVFAFLRVAEHGDPVIAVFNCTPIVRYDYSVGVPAAGHYVELVNTDANVYGGSDVGNWGGVTSAEIPFHGRPHSIKLTLPPLAALILRRAG
ncbi:MAG TPA: 1,4-alpha-glucan branching protein GlgB [Polyangiales bacterium]|nr:1,4-alpha-glucan branching protein GlgB [Polyangiales bacterium]